MAEVASLLGTHEASVKLRLALHSIYPLNMVITTAVISRSGITIITVYDGDSNDDYSDSSDYHNIKSNYDESRNVVYPWTPPCHTDDTI